MKIVIVRQIVVVSYLLAAYSEVVRVASNIENNVIRTEVQEVLGHVALGGALNWV